MNHRIVFNIKFEDALDSVSSVTKQAWVDIGCTEKKDILNKIIIVLNNDYPKLNVTEIEFSDNIEMYGESSRYFGVIKDENNSCVAYVFIIPPKYETRSGVLAQQVFPVLSGIIAQTRKSFLNVISNKPVFVININEVSFTGAMAINVLSGKLLGFNYIDIFNNNIEEILKSNQLKSKIETVEDYDEIIIKNSTNKRNEFFELDKDNKIIFFLPTRLKDGVNVNNEPYWFVLKGYCACYLAVKGGYKISMDKFDVLRKGNKTLDAFRDYVDQLKES